MKVADNLESHENMVETIVSEAFDYTVKLDNDTRIGSRLLLQNMSSVTLIFSSKSLYFTEIP